MINIRTVAVLSVIGLGMTFTSCKKKYDEPPTKEIPESGRITIAELRAKFTGTSIKFQNDSNLYCVVTADEQSGNLYKNVYVRDNTGAINLRLQSSGGLYIGDSIRVNLRNCILGKYNGSFQIDSVSVDLNVVKQKSGLNPQPFVTTIDAITTNDDGKLIQLNNVEFVAPSGLTYADAVNQASVSRTIQDCPGHNIIVRTSGYANFAAKPLPTGNGSLVAIVSNYNGTLQLYVRNYNDVNMNGANCTPAYLNKNFNDASATSGGWTNYNVSGTINWATGTVGSADGSAYGTIKNYVGSNQACETWLISPPMILSGATMPVLSFDNAWKYTGTPLQLLISTDYVSGSPATGTWTALNPTWSSGNFVWANSGLVDLSAYKANNVHIAFKYTGTTSDGSTWEIDNILCKEN
ncbi:MAG: choice-of-anchor J domain-containing protein [Bacteroidetes bacterium]|nr:choice-of-anchor J domain-containing protein [Bacteroidota bacterium]